MPERANGRMDASLSEKNTVAVPAARWAGYPVTSSNIAVLIISPTKKLLTSKKICATILKLFKEDAK